MSSTTILGYAGKILRVDLARGSIVQEKLDEATLRKYVGGTALGAKILYEEVPPQIEWSDPNNILFLAPGPLGGTRVAGSGTFSVVTQGAMTNGATSTQANGFFGAYLRFSGFDGIIVQGAAKELTYLYVHDDLAELRDARHLAGKDTWETEDLIKRELGKGERDMSVFSIGPAGENLVRFAAIVGDRGHVAAHNGVGAVMGSKRLKAIAVARGKPAIAIKNRRRLAAVAKEILESARTAGGYDIYHWGTSRLYTPAEAGGWLPVKNYTTNLFPQHADFMGENVRTRFEIRPSPCWACPANHCHIMRVTEGPYAGFEGEEPEYEQWASWGSQIGQTDPGAAVVLSNEVDRLGMDTNEASWIMGWVMECYEKGILSKKDTDGLEMNWGNVEATRALLRRMALRQGFGNTLAQGVMRAAQVVGGEALDCAIFTKKGNTPRGHDHRGRWIEMFDTCVSSTGTIETHLFMPRPEELGVPVPMEHFSPHHVSTAIAKTKGAMQFEDSLGTCRFITRTDVKLLCEALNAVTGWDFNLDEAMTVGRRAVNLMRAFNLRQGITSAMDGPSPRYGSTPIDGPAKGKGIMPFWDDMLRHYYELMGWDRETGVPLPETLSSMGLGYITEDIWGRKPSSTTPYANGT